MSTNWKKLALSTTAFSLLVGTAFATDYTVNQGTDTSVSTGGAGSGTSGELRYVLNQILNNQAQAVAPTSHTIKFSVPSVTLTNTMPMINTFQTDTITIGNTSGNTTIDGGNAGRPFFVKQGNVTLQNLVIQNGKAQGGNGGTGGGGGGMGAGGALFIDAATVTLDNVSFSQNLASAGLGGSGSVGGGGGGLGGNGGTPSGGGGGYSGNGGAGGGTTGGGGGGASGNGGAGITNGGGGGSGIIGADGGTQAVVGGSVPGYVFGGGGGAGPGVGTNGANGGGTNPGLGGVGTAVGGGGGYHTTAGTTTAVGGFGGGGGGVRSLATGGAGGTGGGGGASVSGPGGAGGYGGGGGATGSAGGGLGGNGGFGGGGGSGSGAGGGNGGFGGGGGGGATGNPGVGVGGFGGGGGGWPVAAQKFGSGGVGASDAPNNTQGGDGAALGGAIFLNTGTLIVQGNSTTSSNSTSSNSGDGASVGEDIFLLSNATLTFNTSGTSAFAGSIADDSAQSLPGGTYTAGTGTGAAVTMVGTGTVVFSGNNRYAGTTIGVRGIIKNNGSTRSPYVIKSSATLAGTGTINAPVTIQSGGFLAPGDTSVNTTGTLTAQSLTLQNGATTQIQVTPTASSQIVATNGATLAGTLQIISAPGTYSNNQVYTFLTAPSITGSFSSVIGTPGFQYTPFLSGNTIQLLAQWFGMSTQGLSGSNKKVADYLNKHAPLTSTIINLAALSESDLKKAMQSISPARNALPIVAGQNMYLSVNEVIASHLSQHRFLQGLSRTDEKLALQLLQEGEERSDGYLANAVDFWNLAASQATLSGKSKSVPQKDRKPYAFWIGAFGENLNQQGRHQAPGFNAWSEAVFAAFDYYAVERGMAGGALGYAHTHLLDDHHMGKANVNYYYSSVYGTVKYSPFYMDLALLGGYQNIDNERRISYTGFHKTAKAHYHVWQLAPHLELGGDIDFSWGGIEPFVAFDFVSTWQEGFKEHGAGDLNMKQKDHFSSMLRSAAGFRFYQKWIWNCGTFLLKEEAAYANRKVFHTGDVNTVIVGGTGNLFVEALQPTQNLGVVGLEGLYAPNSNWPQVSLGYFGEFGTGTQLNQVILKIIKEF